MSMVNNYRTEEEKAKYIKEQMDSHGLEPVWREEKRQPDIHGETCPTCGHKSWYIMKCYSCGAIFCKHCKPEAFKQEDPDDFDSSLEITCDCGNDTLYV